MTDTRKKKLVFYSQSNDVFTCSIPLMTPQTDLIVPGDKKPWQKIDALAEGELDTLFLPRSMVTGWRHPKLTVHNTDVCFVGRATDWDDGTKAQALARLTIPQLEGGVV